MTSSARPTPSSRPRITRRRTVLEFAGRVKAAAAWLAPDAPPKPDYTGAKVVECRRRRLRSRSDSLFTGTLHEQPATASLESAVHAAALCDTATPVVLRRADRLASEHLASTVARPAGGLAARPIHGPRCRYKPAAGQLQQACSLSVGIPTRFCSAANGWQLGRPSILAKERPPQAARAGYKDAG